MKKLLFISLFVFVIAISLFSCEPATFTVQFDADGGTAVEAQLVGEGKTATKPQNPTKEGYYFVGWFAGDTEWSFANYSVYDNLTLKAKWERKSYTVIFDTNGGNGDTEKTVMHGDTVKPPFPSKPKHNFLGWFNGDTKWNFDTPITSDITLTAKWEGFPKKVTFDANGGAVNEKEITIPYGTQIGTLPIPERENFKFLGWFDNTDNQITEAYIVEENITLKAKWEDLSRKITFDANGGTVSEAELTAYCGKEIGILPTPERFLYVFLGWFESSDVSHKNKITDTTIVKDNMSLIARWEIDETIRSVSFDAVGGTLSEEDAVKYIKKDTAIGTLPTPQRDGYQFDGWFNQNNELVSEATIITANAVFSAKWTRLTNTITFDANGGIVDEEQRLVLSDDKIGTLPIPKKEGFVFVGWYEEDDINQENKISDTAIVKGDMHLVAVWESNEILIAIEFDANGGTLNANEATKNVSKNAEIGTLPTPKRSGYNFEGWYYENGEKASSEDIATANTTLVANWVYYITTPCIGGGTSHSFGSWDFSYVDPTCTEDGIGMRLCYNCGGKDYRPGAQKLGHDFSAGGWTYGLMEQSCQCGRCYKTINYTYTSLSDKIKETTIKGSTYGNDVSCLYNNVWNETTGTFCGKGGSVTVDIEFTSATYADCVFIKGAGSYSYSLFVLYEGDTEYTLIGMGAFGENATRFEIGKTITNARISMENGGTGDGYWQEIAFAKIPEIE